MSPAKSSNESSAGVGADDSVAAGAAAGVPTGTRIVAAASVGDIQNAGSRPIAVCSVQTRHPSLQEPLRHTSKGAITFPRHNGKASAIHTMGDASLCVKAAHYLLARTQSSSGRP
jgi:hypothetical protein